MYRTSLKLVSLVKQSEQTCTMQYCCTYIVLVRLVQLGELKAHIQVQSKHITITFTSHGSIIPKEPGKNSPAERSWKARLK